MIGSDSKSTPNPRRRKVASETSAAPRRLAATAKEIQSHVAAKLNVPTELVQKWDSGFSLPNSE
jgi:DNA-binding transcriptional regulator YiaG